MQKILLLGGAGVLLYYFYAKNAANAVNLGQSPAVATKQVKDPNTNTGGLSGYAVSTDQMGNVIYGDNGPRPTDFVNSGNTSDIPATPLRSFAAKNIPPNANPNVVKAAAINPAKATTPGTTAAARAQRQAARNPATLQAAYKFWSTLTPTQQAQWIASNEPLFQAFVNKGLVSNAQVNYLRGGGLGVQY
jgi:hypothetical protein